MKSMFGLEVETIKYVKTQFYIAALFINIGLAITAAFFIVGVNVIAYDFIVTRDTSLIGAMLVISLITIALSALSYLLFKFVTWPFRHYLINNIQGYIKYVKPIFKFFATKKRSR